MSSADRDIADIDFDDLTSPKLTDVQRQVLEFTEAKRVELDIDRMLAEAIDKAGVGSDLDDADGCRVIRRTSVCRASGQRRSATCGGCEQFRTGADRGSFEPR